MAQIPQEYRIAADALASFIEIDKSSMLCESDALRGLVAAPLPLQTSPASIVWLEPQATTWVQRLDQIRTAQRLLVIASRPLAKHIPERTAWVDQPLGVYRDGLRQLRQGLQSIGRPVVAEYGFHTVTSILINRCATLLSAVGQSARADRWHFTARLHYATQGLLANFSTVALLVCQPASHSK